jgi:hypothetical protein
MYGFTHISDSINKNCKKSNKITKNTPKLISTIFRIPFYPSNNLI